MDPREARDVDVTVDGRLATVEQRQSHRRFRENHHERPEPPLTTWGVDRDRAAESMTVRLEAGADVSAADLELDYHPAGPDATPETQFADRYDTVSPGDAVTVDTSDRPIHESSPQPALTLYYGPDASLSVARLLRYRFDAPLFGDTTAVGGDDTTATGDAALNGRVVEAAGGPGGGRE